MLRAACESCAVHACQALALMRCIQRHGEAFCELMDLDDSTVLVACALAARLTQVAASARAAAQARSWGLGSVVFVLLWIAQKTCEDTPVSNADMPCVWRLMAPDEDGCDTRRWNELEAQVLVALDWRTHVSVGELHAVRRAVQQATVYKSGAEAHDLG